ncbi:MAG: CRISPR-associated protein Csx19 [Chloroflexota bacterium]
MIEPLGNDFMANPSAWFETQAQKREVSHLLAFADDGVIRAEVKDGHLENVNNLELLRAETLQRAHLFGENGELRISRKGKASFESVWLDDSEQRLSDEAYPLWSNDAKGEGALILRHYIRYDEQGQAYISHSRLVAIQEV